MLTNEQKTALKIIFESEIKQVAAWGGGTALSENYLHHRKSEDIDIILFDLPPTEELTILTAQIGKAIKALKKKSFAQMNRFQYVFDLSGDKELKLEFVYYPFAKIGKARKVGNIVVESLADIVISKTLSAYQRNEAKDAFDLFVVLKTKKFNIEELISGVERKFSEKIDLAVLLSRLTKNLKNFSALSPLLIKKYSQKEITNFFQKLFNQYLKKQGL